MRVLTSWLPVLLLLASLGAAAPRLAAASHLLIPMDAAQTNHLKAYGIAYWTLAQGVPVQWLLNYRGGAFAIENRQGLAEEMVARNVAYEVLSAGQYAQALAEITANSSNQDAVKLETVPKIAVYSPKTNRPWDDAVTLVLTYAEIPYDVVYDGEVLNGALDKYDWLHLHHEDFTGQYGKFWGMYQHTEWYQDQMRESEALATRYGYTKVSKLKLAVAEAIRDYCDQGGFLFAMCSATDSYDIALAAANTDICGPMFDGDPMAPDPQSALDFSRTLAFQNFRLELDPYEYEYSNIDLTRTRNVPRNLDYFTLFEFSAKWDPVPTMLCQNHTLTVKGFMGQTTSFNRATIKPEVLVMGEMKAANEARYIHGNLGEGMWTFYGGHDPEDYQHFVGETHTDLNLHPNSPGYRLILNNVLFPAARKKPQKT